MQKRMDCRRITAGWAGRNLYGSSPLSSSTLFGGGLLAIAKLFDRAEMGDKWKATDDDIPGTGQSHQRARTETTAVDDTSQAPAEPTATAAGSLQPLPGPAGAPIQFLRGGRGGGSGHGGFSQSAPMTMLQQPLRNQGAFRPKKSAKCFLYGPCGFLVRH